VRVGEARIVSGQQQLARASALDDKCTRGLACNNKEHVARPCASEVRARRPGLAVYVRVPGPDDRCTGARGRVVQRDDVARIEREFALRLRGDVAGGGHVEHDDLGTGTPPDEEPAGLDRRSFA
jgi:hypothetical protein